MRAAPPPPRLLPAASAAAYCSMSVRPFEKLGIGRVVLGTKVLYDRVAIDHHLDQLAGLAPASDPITGYSGNSSDNDDPEAAFDRSSPDFRHAAGRP